MSPLLTLVLSLAALVVAGRTLAAAARQLGVPPGAVSLLEAIALR